MHRCKSPRRDQSRLPRRLSLHLLIGCLTALAAACDAPDERSTPVPVEQLPVIEGRAVLDLASVSYGDSGKGDASLTDVVDILELTPDSIVILDAAPPFIHLVDGDGMLLGTYGPEGDGPGELRRPWGLAADSAHIWLQDRGQLIGWSRDDFGEVRRLQSAPQSTALTAGCGRAVLAIVDGPRPGSGTQYDREYGLAALEGDSTWDAVHPVPPPTTPLQLGWPRFGGSAYGNDHVAIIHWWDEAIELIPCDPEGEVRSYPIAAADEWSQIAVPEGVALLGESVVAFYGDRRMAVDTTHVAVLDVHAGLVRRFKLEGRFALLEVTDGRSWLAHLSLVPVVLSVPKQAFADWVEEEAVPWAE